MKKQDEIEELFSSSFEGFEKVPQMDLKASIDDRLFNDDKTGNRKRRGFYWILTLLFLPGITLFFGLIDFNEVKVTKPQNSEKNIESKWKIVKEDRKDFSTEKENTIEYSRKSISKENYLFGFNFLLNDVKINNETPDYLSDNLSTMNKSFSNKENLNSGRKTNERKPNTYISPKQKKHKKKSNLKLTNSYDYINFPDFRKTKTKKVSNFNEALRIEKTELIKTDGTYHFVHDEVQTVNTLEIENEGSLTYEQVDQSEDNDSDSTIKVDPFNIPTLTQGGNPDTSKNSPWIFSLYSGGTFGINSLKNSLNKDYRLKEQIGFSTNLEVYYSFNSKIGISAGLDYSSRNDLLYKTVQNEDSVFTGYTIEYVYDPVNQDSIVDTLTYANYEMQTTESEYNQIIHHTSFAIPISFSWTIYNKGNWSMRLNSGFRFSYVQNKLLSNELSVEPFMRKFELRVNLRPQLIYTENKIGIGLYMNLGYDIISSITWSGLNIYLQRNRFDLGAGIVLRYQL